MLDLHCCLPHHGSWSNPTTKQASTTCKSRGSSEIEMALAFAMPSCKKAFHVQLVVFQQKRVKRKQSNGGLGTFSIADRERDQF